MRTKSGSAWRRRGKQHSARGLAYLGLMIVIALLSLVAANVVQLGAVHGQRMAEEELLFIGSEFRRALSRYADSTPGGLPRSPLSLDELTSDIRQQRTLRHLRRVYVDPITGSADWSIVHDRFGRIAGIHSRSVLVPIKQKGFEVGLADFERAERYDEWVFWGPQGPGAALVGETGSAR